MSAQRTKQSLDSHHLVVNQSETPKADEFHVTGDTNVPQPGATEPLSVSSSSHNSQSETQHLTSANRRKLGSRRRNKQQQHVKDSATEEQQKPRQELEGNTKGNEALGTTQPERQEELNSQGSKHDSSVTRDSASGSSTTAGYSCEVQDPTTKNPEDIPEILILKSGNKQADKDEKPSYLYGSVETTLEVTGAAAILQSEEFKENIADSSDLVNSLSVTEDEKRREEDSDLLRQDGNVEGNYLKDASHVESVDTRFSTPPEVTTDQNNPKQSTELADDIHFDNQPQVCPVSTKESSDTNFNTSVIRRKLGSTRGTKRRQRVKDPVVESEEEPFETVGGFDTFVVSSSTETDVQVKSVETMLEGMDRSPTDENERKESAHVDILELNSSNFLPTSSEPLINQSNVRERPHVLASVYSETNAEVKERDDDTDLSKPRGGFHVSDLMNESRVKSDLERPMKLETHTEPERCVELTIDSSPNEELSTNEEQIEHFSLSEVRGAQDLYEEEVKPAEIHLADHSFDSANSEICFANLTDQAEVSDSSRSELSVKGVEDSVTEQEVSKPDYKQDEHPEMQSNVEAFKQINEDVQLYDQKKPETSDMERLDTAVVQVYENEGQLEDDIKPSVEKNSHQEKEGLPTDVTESKSPLETVESETRAPFDSQPQDTSVIIDDQNNTDFNPISNRRKLGSSRRNKRQKIVESSGVEPEMSIMLDTEIQEISMQVMQEGRGKVDPTQTEEVSDDNQEKAHSSDSGLTSVSVHQPPVEQQVTDQPNSPASTYSAVTDTESKQDTDLLMRWGFLQADNSLNETHLKTESVASSRKPEITTEKSNYREHTELKYGVEQVAVLSPKEEMSALEGQKEHLSSSEVGGAQHSEDVVREVHEEEVKSIHNQTMHQMDDDSFEERNPCLQTLESETKSPFDSQPVDNSVSIKEETLSGFKLTVNRRKLGSSRRLKGRHHGPEIPEPEEEVVETACSAEEKTEKEKMPTVTMSQEELKEQTSPDINLTKKITSAVEEQGNTAEMPEEDTTLSLNMMDNRTTVTTDFLKEAEDLTPVPVYDVGEMDLIQAVEASVWNDNSDSQNISNHDDNVRNNSVPSDVLDQEETSHIQNTESSPSDEVSVGREICVEQTTNVTESEGDVVLNEAKTLMGALGSEEVALEEECKDPANKDHLAQETNTSIEVTPDAPFSVAQNGTETSGIGHEENTSAKPAEKVGISPAAETSNSRGEMDKEDKTEQRNLDVEVDADVYVINLDRVEELSSIVTKEENAHWSLISLEKEQEINETSSVHNDGQKLQSNTSDLQTIESNMVPNKDDSVALLPDQSAFHNEDIINPVTFVQRTDVRAGEVDVDVSAEPTQQDDFRSNEMQTTSVVIGRRSPSINTEDAINTDSVIIEATQSDKQIPDSIKEGLIQDQSFISVEEPSVVVADQEMVESVIQEPNNAPEGTHKTNFEMKDSSPHVSPNRRRKMGSTRRNLGSRSKVGNSHQEPTHIQSENVESSSQPEKSNYREHTEPKYGVEQVAVSSPKEEMSPVEDKDEHWSSSEVRGALHSGDAVEEVHEEEVKPTHIDDSSVEKRNPCLQTPESETKSPSDSQPVDNSVSIKDETLSGFKLTRNRRKLGSSRRLKGRQHRPEIPEPEEEVVETACSDEEKTEKEKMPTVTMSQEELKEQTSPDFNLTKKITSAVKEQGNTAEMPEEDTTLSLNMMDNRTTVTTDFLKSTEEVKEAEDLTPLPVYDVGEMDLIQAVEASVWNDNSDSQNISNHDDNVRTKSVPSDVLDQEETSHIQNTESSPSDEDSVGREICVQQTTNVTESEGDVVLNEAKTLMGALGSEEVALEEECKDPANKDHLAQETNTSIEVTPDAPFSVAQNETETSGIGHEENTSAKPAEKVWISPAAETSNSRGEMDKEDKTEQRNLDVEVDVDVDVDVINLDRVEVVEELSSIVTKEENAHWSLISLEKEQEINETSSVHNDGQKLQNNTSDLQTIERNMVPNEDDSVALLPDQSAFRNEDVINPVTFVQGTDVRAGEVDVDVSAEPTQQDDFRSNEMQTTSVVIGRRSPSINLLLPPNTEDAINTDSVIIEATQSDKQSPDGIKEGLIQDQPFKSVEEPSVVVANQEMVESVMQEPNNAPEGAHKTNFEMKDSSPHVSLNRRRKMGSTRRNLGSRSKVGNSHQEPTLIQSENVESSSKPEKSNNREHTEPKYGVEQVAVSSPKEEMSPVEDKDEHLSSSEVRGALHSEDVMEEVHEEEVKPTHIDDSSDEERNPSLQTPESETKLPSDSQPVDNSVSIKEETLSGFKLTGNRRKLGSSRRLKGRQHGPEIPEPEEEVVETACSDEEKTEKEKMPTVTMSQEELKEQTSPDFNLTKKITSAVEEQGNTAEMPEEDTTLSLNMMDNRTTVTTDFLNSTEEVKEAKDLTPLPVYDVGEMDLIQAVEASVWNDNSDSQNISNHDDNVRTKSVPSDVLDQEETSHIQNTESSPSDEDSVGREICVEQTTNVTESEGDVVLNEAKTLMGALGSEEVDLEEERKDPANKDHLAQEPNTSIEVTPDAPFSVAQNETETSGIGHEENTSAKPAEKVWISPAAETSNSRGEMDNEDKTEKRNLDVEVDVDVDVKNLDRVEVLEELSSIVTKEENAHWSLISLEKEQEINETSSVHNDGQKLQSNTSDLQTMESNMVPNKDDSVALLPDQSAFHNEDIINPVTFVQRTDVRAGEVDVDVSAEPTQQDDFRSNEMQTTSVVIGSRSPSINLLLPPNTEDAINTDSVIIEATQSDKQSPDSIKEGLIQDQPFKSVEEPSVVVADQEMVESVIQEPNNAPEGAHKTNFEMKDSSPHVSPNRRRKMGSTRRNLGSRSKVENSHQEPTLIQSENEESSSKPEKSNNREHTEPKYGVEQVAVSSPKEEMSPMEDKDEHWSSSQDRGALHSEDVMEEVHEEEVKTIHNQMMHQIDDSSVEERNPCLQTLESETKSPFDSPPVDNSVSIKEETLSGFKLTGNRRKLGSSRRLKGRQHGPEIPEPEEEVVETACSDEEKTEKEKMQLATGTISQEELKEQTSPDFNLTKKITSAVEDSIIIEATQSDKQSPEGIKEGLIEDQPFKSVEEPSVVVADQEMVESVIQEPNNAPEGAHKTNCEMKDSSPHVSPNRRRKMGSTRRNLGSRSKVENSHQEPTHIQSENVESSSQPEKSNYREHTEPKYGVEQVAVSSPKEEMSPVEDKDEHWSSSEVGGALHSGDAVEEVHEEEVKPTHIDDSSVEERNPCLQTLESETKSPSNSQPVDNSVSIKEETLSGFKLTGNRRKLGSSRRLKGRQHGPEIPEPEEEVVENTCSDEEKISIATGTISQEELKEQISPDFNLTKKITSAVEDSVIIEATQSDKQSPEGIKEGLIQDQPLKSAEAPSVVVADQEMVESVIQEPNNAPEAAHKTNFEMKDSSSHVSPNRRRKMGSTRRNLGSRSKVENSHQKQEVDKEDVNVGDVSPESVSVIAEKEPTINDQQENSDSEQRRERVFETVELSHTGESHGKSPAQQTLEENPDSLSQQAEMEHHLTPDYLTALPAPHQHDVTSESAAGGRRRKMGSSRKSRGPQKDDDRTMSAQKERDAILTGESVSKTRQEHREESSALDEISEVDEGVKKSSSGISDSNAPEHSRPLSGKAPEGGTPLRQPYAETRLRQESQNTISLAGDTRGADIGSKRYNVLLVGDSSVGKTSLMQRAQSGKFSFDLPSSVGFDTSMWTVMVDGKPVVLQLWDTAGQERFHSLTRQVFHKAQAFLLMYDITSSQSFTAVSYWANCIQEDASEDVTILLLGNKSDCGERQVKTEEGENLAKDYNFEFMECSAATGDNVIHSLETVARMLREKDDTSEEAMVLHKDPPRNKRSGCC